MEDENPLSISISLHEAEAASEKQAFHARKDSHAHTRLGLCPGLNLSQAQPSTAHAEDSAWV